MTPAFRLKIGSLFAGIGGFDLAARWMGWETAWYSEIEPYACRVMAKNFPGVPNLGDITKITAPPTVDILCGGFPCQDISLAGKGAGIGGERSGLWKHYARLIGEIRPTWVVAENVSALRSRGLDVVLSDLDALGYDASWDCIPASYVGAPHRRDRIWVVAHATGGGRVEEHSHARRCSERGAEDWHRWIEFARERLSADIPDPNSTRLEGHRNVTGRATAEDPTARGGGRWTTEPAVGRMAHGVPSRVDRLRCLGNAVVPQVPYLIFQAIAACVPA